MITVYHWVHYPNPDVTWSVLDAMIGEDPHYQACYFAGLNKPNYPMPTIRYDVAIQSEGIAVINRSKGTIDMVITKRHHIVYDH